MGLDERMSNTLCSGVSHAPFANEASELKFQWGTV